MTASIRVLHMIPVLEAMKPKALLATIHLMKQIAIDAWADEYTHKPMVIGPRTPIRVARNTAARLSLELKATHLLMQDDDMLPGDKALSSLLAADKDIVGALTYDHDGHPCVFKLHKDEMVPWGSPPYGLFECPAVGSGFMLIKTDVFRGMEAPWFYFDKSPRTMDVNFCRDARRVGFEVWCHGSVQVPQIDHREQVITIP